MMKRTIGLLLCAALIFCCLPGCNRTEVPETSGIIKPTQAPTQGILEVELTVPEDERPYVGVELEFLSLLASDDPRTGALEQAADFFEATTGARVNFYWLDGNENVLAGNLAGDVRVDIFDASVDALQDAFGQYAMDLTAMAAEAGYEGRSHRVLRDQVTERCGFLAGIPQTPVLYGMYYNADAVADAGAALPGTWEEFLTFSAQLVQRGYLPMAMDIENSHIALELLLERQYGFETFESLMIQAGWTQTTEYIEFFRRAIDYAEAGYLAKGDPCSFPGGQEKLALSNVVLVPGGSELCGQVERSTMMDVNWGIFPYPGDGTGMGFAVESRTLSVHNRCTNPQAAFDFIMLLTTGSFDQLYADLGNGIPADPANKSSVAGAMELMERADTRGIGLLLSKDNELFSRLWNGWYKTPGYFASAMNGLQGSYAPPVSQGVG